MASEIDQVAFDARDGYALSLFWAQVTEYVERSEHPNRPEDEENFIGLGGEHPGLLFINVPEGRLPQVTTANYALSA